MIKAVIFDIDGVLLDSFEANLKFYQDLMVKNGYRPPTNEQVAAVFHLSMMDGIKIFTGSTSDDEVERIWKMGRDKEVPYPFELLVIPDGVEDVIESLNKNYCLGIVTSRVRKGIYSIPLLKKLEKYFKVAVAYEDTVEHKPNPEPLLLAAEKLGLKPEECVYIGDMESDIIASKAAGMKIIIYSKIKFDQTDAQTEVFTKLPELIELLNKQYANG